MTEYSGLIDSIAANRVGGLLQVPMGLVLLSLKQAEEANENIPKICGVIDRIAGIQTHGTIDGDPKLGLISIATMSRLLLLFAWNLLACTGNVPSDVPAPNSARLPPSDASMAAPIVDAGLDYIGDTATSDAAVAESIIEQRSDYAVGDIELKPDAKAYSVMHRWHWTANLESLILNGLTLNVQMLRLPRLKLSPSKVFSMSGSVSGQAQLAVKGERFA